MVLARAWRRRLYASLGLSVILPTALLCAVALLALNAGFHGLSALGQAYSGPSQAALGAPVLGGAAAGSRAGGPTGTAATFGAAAQTLTGVLGGPATTAPASRGTTTPGVHLQHGSSGIGVGAGGAGPHTGAGVGGGPGGPPPQPHHHPGPGSSPLNPVVRTVTSITSKLPPPVGPAVTRVVKSAGATVNRIIHHPPVPSVAGSAVNRAGSTVKGAGSAVKGAGSTLKRAGSTVTRTLHGAPLG